MPDDGRAKLACMKLSNETLCRFFGALVIAIVLSSCAATLSGPDSRSEPGQLRILTYNIHHGEGMDGAFDY